MIRKACFKGLGGLSCRNLAARLWETGEMGCIADFGMAVLVHMYMMEGFRRFDIGLVEVL
jgi:hypothetical protein